MQISEYTRWIKFLGAGEGDKDLAKMVLDEAERLEEAFRILHEKVRGFWVLIVYLNVLKLFEKIPEVLHMVKCT